MCLKKKVILAMVLKKRVFGIFADIYIYGDGRVSNENQ
jgi:hypothetical protein